MPTAYMFHSPKYRPLDNDGNLMPACYLTFYATGTTDLATIYTDAALTTPASNPLTANANGEFDQIFLDPTTTYRVLLHDEDDVEIFDLDPYTPPRDYPAGSIVMFFGNSTARDAAYPPAQWQVCDGTNGSPDLRDRFVLGAGATYASGDTGGASAVTSSSSGAHDHGGATDGYTLTIDDIPSHHHRIYADNNGGASYASGLAGARSPAGWGINTAEAYIDDLGGSGAQCIEDTGGDGSHAHSISSDGAHTHSVATVPPFTALWFLYKT